MRMQIFFPVVSPQRGGETLGCAEVFIGEQDVSEALPHERFAVDNALNSWALLFPNEHWPGPLCWIAHPCDSESVRVDDPRRWNGASANLATFLAMAHAKKPFRARWLNTEHLWASASLSPHGEHAHIQEVDFLPHKLRSFLECCQTDQGSGRPGVFILPAVSLQKVKKILDSPLGAAAQVEFFEPSKLPAVGDHPLILLVKINQLPALVASLRNERTFDPKLRLQTAVLAVLLLLAGGLGWYRSLSSHPRLTSSSLHAHGAQTRSSPSPISASADLPPTSARSTSADPQPTPARSISPHPQPTPARNSSAERQPTSVRNISSNPPIVRGSSSPRSVSFKEPNYRPRWKTHRRKKHPSSNTKADAAAFWTVDIQPIGYLSTHDLEVPAGVLVSSTQIKIPNDRPAIEAVVVHRTAKMAYEICTLSLSLGTSVLRLRPLQKREDTVSGPSYCLVSASQKKRP